LKQEKKMRYLPIVLSMLLGSVTSAQAQISVGVGISLPGVNIGINVPAYPQFVQVPGYPVYYAPQMNSNYFFYDGLYWVYQGDNWYASSWYNGPWQLMAPEYVPLFVLRIPVRYYRRPPVYFRGWRADRRLGFFSAAGAPPSRHVGVITGATIGNSVAVAGTNGTAAPSRVPHHCQLTNGSIRGIAILARQNNKIRFDPGITATSRVKL